MEYYPTPASSSHGLSTSAFHILASLVPTARVRVHLTPAQLGLAAIAFEAEQRISKTNMNPENSAEDEKAFETFKASKKLASSSTNHYQDAPEEGETRDDKNDVELSPRKRTSETIAPPEAKRQKTTSLDTNQWDNIENISGDIIDQVRENDVLFGRGGNTNRHPGNIEYRNLVKSQQLRYLETGRLHKGEISREIVETIRRRGGRFLKPKGAGSSTNSLFEDVGDTLARAKTSQALREGLNQGLFSHDKADGQVRQSLSALLDEQSQSVVCKLFRLAPKKKRKACSYKQECKPMHPINYNDTDAIIPNDADVVYGKGRAIQRHPGNIRFRNIVNMHRSQYQACTRRQQKAAIYNKVMHIIQASGGRFLLYENGKYVEVDKHRAKEKVSHALRKRQPYANTIMQKEKQNTPSPALFPTIPTFVLPESCPSPVQAIEGNN